MSVDWEVRKHSRFDQAISSDGTLPFGGHGGNRHSGIYAVAFPEQGEV